MVFQRNYCIRISVINYIQLLINRNETSKQTDDMDRKQSIQIVDDEISEIETNQDDLRAKITTPKNVDVNQSRSHDNIFHLLYFLARYLVVFTSYFLCVIAVLYGIGSL